MKDGMISKVEGWYLLLVLCIHLPELLWRSQFQEKEYFNGPCLCYIDMFAQMAFANMA